jgi:hypothetical protein
MSPHDGHVLVRPRACHDTPPSKDDGRESVSTLLDRQSDSSESKTARSGSFADVSTIRRSIHEGIDFLRAPMDRLFSKFNSHSGGYQEVAQVSEVEQTSEFQPQTKKTLG